MASISDEIARAMLLLGISTQDCRMLAGDEARAVYQAVESRFVTQPGRRWWWEVLAEPNATHAFTDGNGFARLHEIAPNTTVPVWFIADADEEEYAVYETSVLVAQRIIGDCSSFEYVLASTECAWAIGENHHDVVWGVGDPVVSRLIAAAQQ
jgi:hypothetical protein